MVAVDPTSPFTGGAILGDRLRMQAHADDPDVFIRSHGHARPPRAAWPAPRCDAALVLDAAGKTLVIIETVGVGQDEVDIVRTADISVVVLVPGTGDDVQALKAGIMEIADIFVVNKADRDGADRMVTSIESNLSLQSFAEGAWRPPILKTEATTGRGVPELWQAIQAFRAAFRRARAPARLKARQPVPPSRAAGPPLPGVRRAAAARARASSTRWSTASPRAEDRSVLGRRGHAAPEPCATADEGAGSITSASRSEDVEARSRSSVMCSACTSTPPRRWPASGCARTSCPSGPSSLELLEATAPDSPIAQFVEQARPRPAPRGPARWTTSTRRSPYLRRRGVRLIDDVARPGAEGARVAFIHPVGRARRAGGAEAAARTRGAAVP